MDELWSILTTIPAAVEFHRSDTVAIVLPQRIQTVRAELFKKLTKSDNNQEIKDRSSDREVFQRPKPTGRRLPPSVRDDPVRVLNPSVLILRTPEMP
jgi:hypothetical protein